MAFWNKRIKNVSKTAESLGEEKEKVKALKEGDLEIGGKTMDRVLKTLEEDKIQGLIKDNDVWKWVQETDFKKLRQEFGYKSQVEVAKYIGCDSTIICSLEGKKGKFKRVTPMLIKIYDFYTNDFNKKINRDANPSVKVSNISLSKKDFEIKDVTNKTKKELDKEKKTILKWYKKTNIKELRKSFGFSTAMEAARIIGVTQSCYNDLENKKYKGACKTMTMAYNFYNAGSEVIDQIPKEENKVSDTVIEETKKLMEETTKDFIIQNLTEENKHLKRQIEMYEKLISKL